MDTQGKLDILSSDAQYDLSCSCGTNDPLEQRKRSADGSRWLYPVTTASGGAGIMLKTLMGNRCAGDCRYCPLRSSADFRPVALSSEEIVRFFLDLTTRRKLIGLFLSSAVLGTPDKTMQLLIDAARQLRVRHRYRGYIHLKIIPGCSMGAIDEAIKYASALSLNIEVPSARHYEQLSAYQSWERDIAFGLNYLTQRTAKGTAGERCTTSTQFIVGASDEEDREILGAVNHLYQNLGLDRSFFSAYQRGLGDSSIPGEKASQSVIQPDLFDISHSSGPLVREHRLYQAEWLLRVYGFSLEELCFSEDGNLSLLTDPKLTWARANTGLFPLSVNRASEQELLRVPGIGPVWAKRIIALRRQGRIGSLHNLRLPVNSLPYLIR